MHVCATHPGDARGLVKAWVSAAGAARLRLRLQEGGLGQARHVKAVGVHHVGVVDHGADDGLQGCGVDVAGALGQLVGWLAVVAVGRWLAVGDWWVVGMDEGRWRGGGRCGHWPNACERQGAGTIQNGYLPKVYSRYIHNTGSQRECDVCCVAGQPAGKVWAWRAWCGQQAGTPATECQHKARTRAPTHTRKAQVRRAVQRPRRVRSLLPAQQAPASSCMRTRAQLQAGRQLATT